MPTVLRVGAYRFFFYSVDANEPPHIHVERDDHVAKFWLEPVRLVQNERFPRPELRQVKRLVGKHEITLMEAWCGYFGS